MVTPFEIVDKDHELLEKGISQLLGKEQYDKPEVVPEPCKHVSDGFVYDDTPIYMTLQCIKCGIQYDVSKLTGLVV